LRGATYRTYLARLAAVVFTACSIASAACSSDDAPAPPPSPQGIFASGCNKVEFEGHEYRFCSSDKSWASARSDCLAAGMDLVTVDSLSENAFIVANLTGASWMGASDSDAEGVWKWIASGRQFWQGDKNGSAVGGAFSKWQSGQPDDLLAQDCGRIGGDGTWSDEYCSIARDYVCEGEGVVKGQPPDTNCQGAVLRGVEYWFCTNDLTWEEARDRCRTQPGLDLASIKTSETNRFVFERMKESSWIGGSDRASEGEWRWAEAPSDDGSLFWLGESSGTSALGVYTNWDHGEPEDPPIEDCLEMPLLHQGKWNDQSCFVKHGFACQGSTDLCLADPNKSTPGVCGCGVPDKDTDGDAVMDCVDQCPRDPLRVTPGTCGCVGNASPAPSGTACSDGLCSKNNACDGAGSCGSPSQCAPQSGCELRTFQRKAYWFCPSLVSWQTARQKCTAVPRTTLASIDDQYENSFVYRHISRTSWSGGNDLTTEGKWRWATASSTDGPVFWNGAENGAAPRGGYSNWELVEPDVLADCASLNLGDKGQWESQLCSSLNGYVCETCLPTTCAAEGAECGTVPDGCGGTLDCSRPPGGCSGDEVCFAAANRCSKPDGKACQEAIKADFSLPIHERMLQLNRDYAACLRPGIDECQVEFLARVRTDRQIAATLCFASAINPSLHNTIEYDRAAKKERARNDPSYACRVRDGDGDRDLVPDDIDRCPDTLPLMPTDEFGCDTPARLPGPDREVTDLGKGVISHFSDPACHAMGVPETPLADTMVGLGVNGAPGIRNKGIIMGAVDHPPGCEMFYEVRIDARLADGSQRSFHIAWAEAEATSAGYGGRNGLLAVLFQALPTDDGDRGEWSRADVVAASYSLRARNKAGVASDWSRFVQMGREPRVGAWGLPP
jgi:hypothetical protein